MQYNQIKKILMNFCFKERNKTILSTEINNDVLDELRRQRKILMVLQDKNVDSYITMDMTEIDIYDKESWSNEALDIQLVI